MNTQYYKIKYCNDVESKTVFTKAENSIEAICFVVDNFNVDIHDIDYCDEIDYNTWILNLGV
jgi:hypothetical protein